MVLSDTYHKDICSFKFSSLLVARETNRYVLNIASLHSRAAKKRVKRNGKQKLWVCPIPSTGLSGSCNPQGRGEKRDIYGASSDLLL